MGNKYVVFPADKLAEAQAYKEWGDEQFRALSGENDGVLGLVSTDAFGRHVTTYYGPPLVWSEVVPEPEAGPAMRAAGELSDTWTRPEGNSLGVDDEALIVNGVTLAV